MRKLGITIAPRGETIMKSKMTVNCRNPRMPITTFSYCENWMRTGALVAGISIGFLRRESDAGLHVESKVHHIALFDDVFLAFQAQLSGLLRACLALEFDEVIVGNYFGANEAALEIGVDDARRLRRRGARMHRPRTHFFGAGSEISLQAQQ